MFGTVKLTGMLRRSTQERQIRKLFFLQDVHTDVFKTLMNDSIQFVLRRYIPHHTQASEPISVNCIN